MGDRDDWLHHSRRALALIREVIDMPDIGAPVYTPEQRADMEAFVRRVEAGSLARSTDDGGDDDESR